MFEYKFVKAPISFSRDNTIQITACEAVVADHAAQGWRLVQFWLPIHLQRQQSMI